LVLKTLTLFHAPFRHKGGPFFSEKMYKMGPIGIFCGER